MIDAVADTATDRDEFRLADSAWRPRSAPPARPRQIRRNRRPGKQLPPRTFARREVHGRWVPATTAPVAAPPETSKEPSDDTLLAGMRAGDLSAGEALVERYHGPLLRYLQRLAGPDIAEELHQQTWLSVLDHVGAFQSGGGSSAQAVRGSGGGFKAWLFRIATNKANDLWRSRGRERNAKEGLKRILDPVLPHAAVRAEATERNHSLSVALEQLPREQREAIVLRFYSNMKFSEIADVVGCPVNTALTRVHKGILKLRQLMEPE